MSDLNDIPIPDDENARLRALRSYGVLDTAPEQEFDDLAMLASHICETPIALVSLVDSERQWFKARVGLDLDETPRFESICQHTILSDDVLEVPDATLDPRFDSLPLVLLEEPRGIRFYAGVPLRDPHGHNLGTLCVIDTEPRRLEADQKRALSAIAREVVARLEERRQSALLRRTNERLDKFTRIAAHDLKAPLRAIATLASFVSEDLGVAPAEEIRSHLELIRGRAGRMQSLIDGLLQYSQIGAHDGDEIADPNTAVGEVLKAIDPRTRFEIAVSPDMPKVHLSSVRFQQVVQNLVDNAIKYHDRGDGRIEIGWRDEGEKAAFYVSDDGPGIERRYHDRIFDTFETLHARDDVESTGIGLAIVKGIVEEEGGSVWVESRKGAGATFWFTAYRASD